MKYITVKGPDRLAREPFYMGIPQHVRTLSRREFYDLVAGRTGYRPTAVKSGVPRDELLMSCGMVKGGNAEVL